MAPENAPTQQSGENTASQPPSWPTEQGEWIKMATEGTGFRGSAAPPKHEEVAAAVDAVEPPPEPGTQAAPAAADAAPPEAADAAPPEAADAAPPEAADAAPPEATDGAPPEAADAAPPEDDPQPAFLGRVTGSD